MNANPVVHVDVVIPSGQSQSGVVDTSERVLGSIHMPAAWTAANITFLAATTPTGTFQPVHDADGVELVVTTAAARVAVIAPDATRGLRYVKLRSGTAALPVTQAAERTLPTGLVYDIRT